MKISVIVPAYNVDSYIERAISSILCQTVNPYEIIVVNDGSTDQTAEKIRIFGSRIRSIDQDNKGLSSARNTGIKAAAGDWIAFLDGDDQWLPNKLELQCALLERYPKLNWIGANLYQCNCQQAHQQTPQLTQHQQAAAQNAMKTPGLFPDYFTAFKVLAAGHPNTMMIRKDILLQAGLFYEASPMFEDNDMWMRLAYLNLEYGYVMEPVAVYHLGIQGSLTRRFTDFQYVDDYMQRHLKLSEQAGKSAEFRQYAQVLLSYRAGFLMALGKGDQVRSLVRKYGSFLAPSYRMSCYAGSFCPGLWNAKETLKKRIRGRRREK